VAEVLERTFGPDQAIASVDVTLGRSHSKVTTESVLGNGAGAGVKVRERVTSRDGAAEGDAEHPGTSSHEADYQVGRRVEQVVSGAGGVARINVAVVVRANQDQQQLDRLRDVVALAAGIDRERGDAVSVYAMGQLANPQPVTPTTLTAPKAGADELPAAAPAVNPAVAADGNRSNTVVLALAALCAVAAAGGAGVLLLGRRRSAQTRLRQLSLDERRAVLAQVNTWLEAPRQPLREES
jgi:flagellar M-ring protein FliF